MSKPILVITLGPTGSGKGGALTKLKEIEAYRDKLDSVVVTGVDEIVVEHPYYKQTMKTFLEKKSLSGSDGEETIKNFIFNLTPDDYGEIEKIYFEARYLRRNDGSMIDKKNCEFDAENSRYTKKPHCKTLPGSCEEKNNDQIKDAMEKKSNLLIESTGAYYPEWLLEDKTLEFADLLKKKNGYQVIFVWNYVQICTLVERILNRTINQIMIFLENTEANEAPRFPNFLRLIKELPSIHETFKSGRTLEPKENSGLEYINYYIDNTPGFDETPNPLVQLKTEENFKNKYEGYNTPDSSFLHSKIIGMELLKSFGNQQKVCDGKLPLVEKIKEKLLQEGKKSVQGGGMKKKRRTSRRSKNKRVGKRKYKKTKRLHRKKRKTKKLN